MDTTRRTLKKSPKVVQDRNNSGASARVEPEVSPLAWRNLNHRCMYFTFIAKDPNGNWTTVQVPVYSLDGNICSESKSQEKSPSRSSFIKNGCNVSDSSDFHIDISEVDKPQKRIYKKKRKKKGKKKGKKSERVSLDAGLTEVSCVHGSSMDDSQSSTKADSETDSLSYETTSVVLSPDSCSNCSEGFCGEAINDSELLKTISTHVDEADILESNLFNQSLSANSRSKEQSAIPELSALRRVQDSFCESEMQSHVNGLCRRVLSEANCSLALDSVAVCSDADDADEKVNTCSSVFSEANESLMPDSISFCANADEIINEASDTDIHFSSGMDKKYKQNEEVIRNDGISQISSLRKYPSHHAKENIHFSHFSWQKVRRKGPDECGFGLRKVKSFDSKNCNVSTVKKNQNLSRSSIESAGEEDKNRFSVLFAEENKNRPKIIAPTVKRKSNAAPRKELNCYSRKRSYASKSIANLCVKVNREPNNELENPVHSGQHDKLVAISSSLSKDNCTKTAFQTEEKESDIYGYVHCLESHFSKLEPLEQICITSSSILTHQTVEQDCNSLMGHCHDRSKAELLDGQLLYLTGSEGSVMEKDVFDKEHDMHGQVSGGTMHSVTPFGTKISELATPDHSNSSQFSDKEAKSCNEENPVEKDCEPLLGHCDDRSKAELLYAQLCNPTGSEDSGMKRDVSATEHDLHMQVSRCTMHLLIPLVAKDSELARPDHSDSLEFSDKEAVESCNLENTVKKMAPLEASACTETLRTKCSIEVSTYESAHHSEALDRCNLENTVKVMSYLEDFACSENSSMKCSKEGFSYKGAQHFEAEVSIDNESKGTAVDNDTSMISKAVNNAYRAQLASEAVEKATGRPVAELERFLSSASPVISLAHDISQCQTCSSDEVSVASLCRHEIPSLSLGSLWEWYEKHGTFGLEIKAEDMESSKRFGIDQFAFRAYFVPFLSGVQLFSSRRGCSLDTSKRDSAEGTEVSKLGESSFAISGLHMSSTVVPQPMPVAVEGVEVRQSCGSSSTTSGLDIFSMLVPRPKKEGMSPLPARSNNVYCNDSRSSDDFELVYEYFEAEQPQRRKPLFDIIKDLAGGNKPSQGSAFGDPSKLVSLTFKDLHPKSWYSVAWYPIYRIPDGNLRAAFLTYHSLSHLVHKSTSSDFLGSNGCIVSPVVGLQSYNTQGECWLQPRISLMSETKEIPNLDPCKILKERLRALEHTASLMARAEVTKGDVVSVNRQPDYEFFVSRRRW